MFSKLPKVSILVIIHYESSGISDCHVESNSVHYYKMVGRASISLRPGICSVPVIHCYWHIIAIHMQLV